MNFFRNILWKLKRAIIIILFLIAAAGFIFIFVIFRERAKMTVFSAIIDADSGNGVSDLLAISRALADPEFKVIGLTSVQWYQFQEATGKTVDLSQSMNDTLLKLFRKEDIPHPKGGERMLGTESGFINGTSAASDFIVEKASEASAYRKLNIITLGPMTNLANAILTDSTIIPKIRIYSVAMKYDPSTNVWNKNESNSRNDLDALDLVLNTDKLELHIMPVSIPGEFVIGEDEALEHLKNKGGIPAFISELWINKFPARREVTVPDVALIEAVLRPDFAKEEKTKTPPENKNRQVFVYSSINKEFMKIDFWKAIKKYVTNNP